MADCLEIARECYDAYVRSHLSLIEAHLSDDLRFYAPPDPGIDREAYFERCWPGHVLFSANSSV